MVQGEELARDLGFKSHSGPARTLIGAMRQYGLLEKQGGGTGLSPTAQRIIRSPEGSEEHAAAIREAALIPNLFRDLYATHRGEPEDAIKSYLKLRRGFTEEGAAVAASAYRDTISFAKLTRHYGNGAAEAGEMPGRAFAKEPEYGIASREAAAPLDQKPDHSLLTQTLMISIPRNFRVDVNVHGDRIERGDLARIKNQLDRRIEGLEDAFE